MTRTSIDDMMAFLEVARERSFTRAASKLGVTPSALSHSMRALEERLGLRLLSRTTRNVAPTEAGERLMRTIGPHIEQIDVEISALSELRDKPAGNIRVTCSDYVIDTIFRPILANFLYEYPDIKVELSIDNGFTNIVEERFDAGVRLGEAISKDMIAVRIGPDWRFTVVGSPGYFRKHSKPKSPQDLTKHACINMRLVSAGGIYSWEFEKDGRKLNVRVGGQLAFNTAIPIMNAAIDGHGLAYVPKDLSGPHIKNGSLVEVLSDWCPQAQGYHLYYPSHRQNSPAFAAFLTAIRYRR